MGAGVDHRRSLLCGVSNHNTTMNFYDKADKTPPILVRLLARKKNGPPLSDLVISERSKLSLIQVHIISQSLSWDDIPITTMRKFMVACEVDIENPEQFNRVKAYLRRPTWKYLRTSPLWRSYYLPLVQRYLASLKRK
jgi:hypothetical protein